MLIIAFSSFSAFANSYELVQTNYNELELGTKLTFSKDFSQVDFMGDKTDCSDMNSEAQSELEEYYSEIYGSANFSKVLICGETQFIFSQNNSVVEIPAFALFKKIED